MLMLQLPLHRRSGCQGEDVRICKSDIPASGELFLLLFVGVRYALAQPTL